MKPHDKTILVVSFGTSYNDNCVKTIGEIEKQIAERYPDWDVRRAFTSKMIIKKLMQRDNKKVDYVTDAMEKLISDGIKTVVVQPTHIMNGTEYDDVVRVVSLYSDNFDHLSIGRPLLTSMEDYDDVVDALGSTIIKDSCSIAGPRAATVLMGHGTEHYANSSYSQLYLKLLLSEYPDVYVATVDGFPEFEDAISLMKKKNYRDVVLFPFMLVAGDHAHNDMGGEGPDSLKSIMEKNGYRVHCVVKGLGEYQEFRDIILAHTEDAVTDLILKDEICYQ